MPEPRRIIFAIIFFMLVLKPSGINLSAQDLRHNLISVSSGLQFAGTRDLVYSPLLYSGTEVLLSLEYRYSGMLFSHGVELFYSAGANDASTGSSMTTETGGLKFGYNRIVYTVPGSRLKLSAGAMGSFFFLMRKYDIVPSIGGSLKITPSPEFYLSAELALTGEYMLNDRSGFNCRIWFPLVSYFLRSEYTEHAGDRIKTAKEASASDVLEAGQTSAPWGDYFHVGSSLAFERKLSEYFIFSAEYSLLYQNVKTPVNKENFNNTLRCRIAFLF